MPASVPLVPPLPSAAAGHHEVARNRWTLSPVAVAAVSALVLIGLLGVLYKWVLPPRSGAPAAASLQTARNVGGSSQHPLAKHLEVGGLRIVPAGDSTLRVQYVVVNHSAADLPDLRMEVTLRSAKGEPVIEFASDVPSVGPYESKELTSTVRSALKPYEVPDWQMLRADFRLLNEP